LRTKTSRKAISWGTNSFPAVDLQHAEWPSIALQNDVHCAMDAIPYEQFRRSIANELITNAAKHAGRSNETIHVHLARRADDTIELSVQDRGVGLPQEFDLRTASPVRHRARTGRQGPAFTTARAAPQPPAPSCARGERPADSCVARADA
jgi:hypothetical protein